MTSEELIIEIVDEYHSYLGIPLDKLKLIDKIAKKEKKDPKIIHARIKSIYTRRHSGFFLNI